MLATIDIGTNTLLLLVAEGPPSRLRAVYEDCQFGRLGQGLDRSGRLHDDAIARSLDALRSFRAEMDRRGVTRVAAVGTQALREAANAGDFLAPARDILGVGVEVISGEREAELVHVATVRSFPQLAQGELVIADVGGGSTEVIVCDRAGVHERVSIPIGSVRLAERHLRDDPPTPAQTAELEAAADEALAVLELPPDAHVVGTAGTATTLVSVELALAAYDPERVHGVHLSLATIERQLARYLTMTVAERRQIPGLEAARADVIPAGAAIFARLLRRADAHAITISDRGVRWGLAYELVAASAR